MKLLLHRIASFVAGMMIFLLGGWMGLLSLEYFTEWTETWRGLYLTSIGLVSLILSIYVMIAMFRYLRTRIP